MESVSVQIVADYLYYMFDNLGRKVATISNHRTALSAALGEFDGFTIGNHPILTSLINSFWVKRPMVRPMVPEWDLTTVLQILRKAPFEPPRFDTVQQKKLTTWKTVFLLALACAKRASEIHAISRDPSDLIFEKDGVWLRFHPEFIAKTQRLSSSSEPFLIPSIDRKNPDRYLCPVRMLKFYLSFTGGLIKGERLFKKCAGEGYVCTKTISSWLKSVICYSHDHSVTARGHEVRKMAASWAHVRGASTSDILKAASWASTGTFVTHYLMDVRRQMDGKYRLCPVLPGYTSNK